jgi:hypothetical protein
MHVRQSVAYKQFNKERIMKQINLQWPLLLIQISPKINLVRLRLISKKQMKKLKYAFHHNIRKFR